MKKETGIILAAGFGLFAVLGAIALRRIFNSRHNEYNEYYSDYHRHFEKRHHNDDYHGVEYLSMN